ncbi:translation elongation factor Ts [Xylanimonas cellulosilytica DSM 15894]|uniref:Elongation factor Ts n=1 Tax=Xylanimonas cellulosilytica (strain DSM 15894 / JCM 12276 / CECT 5975 / KCTC 9989 / LMG 20990 / NBRC 107835 / XIL07) TaxID=446471 RepID=D1C023_XYLCX|nr:translation elongation factor Ts [Xylanimonas cellulosilytica]ACZ30212.1 translation elongation factor Ts [Xylanimonas cellulosilytica DSM 15894]
MANYTIQDIKDLRALTGAGMTDVKKALDEADGDQQQAVELIRKRGLAKAAKREGNATSEGLVAVKVEDAAAGQAATLIELNAETDFVVKNEKFIALADQVLDAVAAAGAADATAALAAPVAGETVADLIAGAAGTMGEKIVLARVARAEGPKVTTYLHRTAKDLPPSIGVVVVTDEAAQPVAKDVAQHIAAMAPKYLTRDEVPAEVVDKEREIARELSIAEGKPEAALPKIVEGRLNGFFKENVLVEQPLAKDTKVTVAKHVEATGGQLTGFVRFRVGN